MSKLFQNLKGAKKNPNTACNVTFEVEITFVTNYLYFKKIYFWFQSQDNLKADKQLFFRRIPILLVCGKM
jgi:hypothetical protein